MQKLSALQQAILPTKDNIDIVNWIEFKNTLYLTLIKIRQGKLIDKLNFRLNNLTDKPSAIISSFIKQHYLFLKDQPKIIITPYQPNLTTKELETIFANKITIRQPQKANLKNC